MKVLLVDDHNLFAKSFGIALSDFTEIDKFYSIDNVNDISRAIAEYMPDIILMDINLSNICVEDGLILSKKIIEKHPQQKIVMLSGYDLPIYRSESKKIGAKGFVSKNTEPKTLIDILVAVSKGATYFKTETELFEELTDSEKQVLKLLADGKKRKEIATTLFASERTVSNHLQHIFEKLDVTSAVEAITKAIQMGYISPIT